MTQDLAYLLSFLEDEFRNDPAVRIQPVFPAGTRRSLDLPQDYDPESSNLHRGSGVRISSEGQSYFFPAQWITERQFGEINKLVNEIRERF